MTKRETKAIQAALMITGHYYGAVDGSVGALTKYAIASFRVTAGLSPCHELQSSVKYMLFNAANKRSLVWLECADDYYCNGVITKPSLFACVKSIANRIRKYFTNKKFTAQANRTIVNKMDGSVIGEYIQSEEADNVLLDAMGSEKPAEE